jgi:hypothetical protein
MTRRPRSLVFKTTPRFMAHIIVTCNSTCRYIYLPPKSAGQQWLFQTVQQHNLHVRVSKPTINGYTTLLFRHHQP